jgi:CelD/BcsL family acetyltransferase involved in cellulose biosynthesis
VACCGSDPDSGWREELEEAAAALLCLDLAKERKHRYWVHEVNKNREESGVYHRLINDLEEDDARFNMYFRMRKEQFIYLHNLLKDDFRKNNTRFLKATSSEQRLAVCLRCQPFYTGLIKKKYTI